MIERYVNLPLKKALTLLFVCVILLACVGTAGCPFFSGAPAEKTTHQTGYYRVQKIDFTKIEHRDGTRDENVEAAGGSWDKKLDKNGLLTWEKWVYPDVGPEGQQTHNPPITDPHPGATQGEVLIDYHLDSTAPAPTAVPTVQPLELPVEGGHSHVEGGD